MAASCLHHETGIVIGYYFTFTYMTLPFFSYISCSSLQTTTPRTTPRITRMCRNNHSPLATGCCHAFAHILPVAASCAPILCTRLRPIGTGTHSLPVAVTNYRMAHRSHQPATRTSHNNNEPVATRFFTQGRRHIHPHICRIHAHVPQHLLSIGHRFLYRGADTYIHMPHPRARATTPIIHRPHQRARATPTIIH